MQCQLDDISVVLGKTCVVFLEKGFYERLVLRIAIFSATLWIFCSGSFERTVRHNRGKSLRLRLPDH